ncbi:ABC transporter permease [Mycoplasmatota bacterium]|nr:ABC transporter permease [Mycoplasmatota bacterium]
MMIFKLSYQNVKKNFHDYTIYFITLTLTVSFSYIFNLLKFQPFMKEFSENSVEDLTRILTQLSLSITLIVTGLALYSNNFILKKRSREIGIYLMLGLKYSQVHLMMILETLIISVISFVSGCVLGIFGTRIFDLLIIKLLGLKIQHSTILFERTAFINTLFTFFIIFVLISIFNYFIISRANLINIVKSKRAILKKRKRKGIINYSVICFVLSIVAIIYFYILMLKPNIDFTDTSTEIAFGIGLLGHIGIFLFGSSVMSFLISHNRKKMYSGINLFSNKQLTSKVGQNGILLSIISFVMSLTLVMLNLGFSAHIWIDENLKYTAPYSISVSGIQPDVSIDKVTNYIKEQGYTIEKEYSFPLYRTDYTLSYFLDPHKTYKLGDEYAFFEDISTRLIMLSDYNKVREISGYKSVLINQGEYLLHADKAVMQSIGNCREVKISSKKLFNPNQLIYLEPLNDSRGVIGGGVTIVVSDEDFINSKIGNYDISLIINTKELRTDMLKSDFESNSDKGLYNYIASYSGGHQVILRSDQRDYNLKQASSYVFTGLFIGSILLIVGASILSLQQMTETMDNKRCYEIMNKLGVKKADVHSSIFKQIFMYFSLPLIVAISHSIVGTIAMSSYSLMTVDAHSFIYSTVISSIIFMIIYIVFILFTHERCKKIISD